MKKIFVLLVVAIVLGNACTRSQFSTTTRHSNNGRISYTNHYPVERNKKSKGKPYIQNVNAKDNNNHELIDLIPDTSRKTTTDQNLTFDPSFANIITFKDGKTDTVRIVSHSEAGLYYNLLCETKRTRFASMEQVETFLVDTAISFKPEEAKSKVKASSLEKKGLIHSIIGFIPIAGIPFAIVGIIIGARSLHRIRKNLASIEGKNLALSTLIIGIVALIFNIIITIVILSAIIASMDAAITGCDLGHF